MRSVHFDTREQVHNYMVDALAVLKSAKVPDELQAVALPIIFTALSAKQVFLDQSDASGGVLLAAPAAGDGRMQ